MMKPFFVFCFCFCASFASARIYINIGVPTKINKSVLSVSNFRFKLEGSQPNLQDLKLAKTMTKRFSKNMKFSGYFNLLSSKAHIKDINLLDSVPYNIYNKGFIWENLKLSGTDFVFFADYFTQKDKQLVVSVYFYNVNSRKRVFKKTYKSQISQSVSLIDKISNDIVQKINGRKSIFESKIASIRSTGKSTKELFVMGWNGENKKRITYHRSIALSPSWSNKGHQLTYSAFVHNKKLNRKVIALFLYDFATNKIKVLSADKGSALGSAFFPKDKELLITKGASAGQMDIVKLNLKDASLSPLIKGPARAINVEPSIHSQTRKLVFSSDRKGKTMIFTANPTGTDIKQITFAGNHNASPDWHPYKNKIVFSGLSKGRMDLFLISANGTGLKRLTSLKRSDGTWAHCESPSFSPDGRFVVFSSDISGNYQLYVLNIENLSIERITFDRYNYKSPKWSPFL